jgi:cold-inducible RNA-binding protein
MNNNKVHVANLAATSTERDLHALFSAHGNVAEVNLPVERESGRPRGFAIVTMATPQGANAAILGLNGKEVEGRVLTVAEYVFARKEPSATGQRGTVSGSAVKQHVSATPRRFWSF